MKSNVGNISAKSIEYLALEGGGGKGMAYLGAIRILESLDILPLNKKKLKGFAGASSGSITSFLLSIGLNSKEIEDVLTNNDFGTFMDDPHPGVYKAVYPSSMDKSIPEIGFAADEIDIEVSEYTKKSSRISRIGGYRSTDIEEVSKKANTKNLNNTIRILIRLASPFIYKLDSVTENPVVKKMFVDKKKAPDYVQNLLRDRGIFTGVAVREFFVQMLFDFLPVKFPDEFGDISPQELESRCRNMNFNTLYNVTGVFLKIVSVNATKGVPVEFSALATPSFPVVEALCMSMSIPGAFKPTFNGYNVKQASNPGDSLVNAINDKYIGLFVDGGTINNFPLHLYDEENETLNSRILGIRLTGGADPADKKWVTDLMDEYRNSKLPFDKKKFKEEPKLTYTSEFSIEYPKQILPKSEISFLGWVGNIMNSLMFFSEEGQIRTKAESRQVLELFSYTLTTLNFTPDDVEKSFAIQKAEKKTKEFFGIST